MKYYTKLLGYTTAGSDFDSFYENTSPATSRTDD